MSIIDPIEVADDAGLRHVRPDELPITRRVSGRGFSYLDGHGRLVADRQRDRLEALAIPPAWTEVRIAADDRSHVQAVGVDEAGRTQYRYHEAFRAAADHVKFERLAQLCPRLPRLRATVRDELARYTDPSAPAASGCDDAAVVLALIDHTLVRVGSERNVEDNDTYGASTLRRRHVEVRGPGVVLRYEAKGGIEREVDVDDPVLAVAITRCRDAATAADDPIFTGPEGGSVTGESVRDRLSEWIGFEATAKELRTWGASAAMVRELMAPDLAVGSSSDDPVLAAFDGVAARLGNTRDVARSSYVAPRVIDAWESEELHELWRRSRRSSHYARAEQCARKLFCT